MHNTRDLSVMDLELTRLDTYVVPTTCAAGDNTAIVMEAEACDQSVQLWIEWSQN